MKHGKKPTVEQRKLLQKNGLDWKDWLIVKDMPNRMEVVHRQSATNVRSIPKGGS